MRVAMAILLAGDSYILKPAPNVVVTATTPPKNCFPEVKGSSMKISVIGTGLMGSAIVHALLSAQRDVYVWSRTPSRCQPLVDAGATLGDSAQSLITECDVTLFSVSGASDVRRIVASLPESTDLSGRCLVNLATGEPEIAGQIDELVRLRDGDFIDGRVLGYPDELGTEKATILFAGTDDARLKWQDLMRVLAPQGSMYVGTDLAAPGVMDVALVAEVWATGLAAFLEGAAYATSQGVGLSVVARLAERMLALLAREIIRASAEIEMESFTSDQATLNTWRDGIEKYHHAIADAGQPAFLLEALLRSVDHARSLGHGEESFSTQYLAAQNIAADPGRQ
jgi:3-hydroxyisobutyrate dehydrogenase-like beta-hydroxyacid dehydrogenase